MPKPLKAIRHEIYDWLKEQEFDLTDERRAHLSSLIREHSDARLANLKEVASLAQRDIEKLAFVKGKVKTAIMAGEEKLKSGGATAEAYKNQLVILKQLREWLK